VSLEYSSNKGKIRGINKEVLIKKHNKVLSCWQTLCRSRNS